MVPLVMITIVFVHHRIEIAAWYEWRRHPILNTDENQCQAGCRLNGPVAHYADTDIMK